MDSLNRMVLGDGNERIYDARLVIADNYNILVDKTNELITNTLSTELDTSTTKIKYIRVCTQEEYDLLTISNFPQLNNTVFFITT
jgi:hypothetical protein